MAEGHANGAGRQPAFRSTQRGGPLPPLPPDAPSPSSSSASSSAQAAASAAATASPSSSRTTAALSTRLQTYTSLLSADNLLPGHTVADLYSLRHLSIQGGVPDQPGWLRPQAWRVLLGYLPPEKRDWPRTLASRRHEYAQFLVDFLQPLAAPQAESAGLPGRSAERDQLLDQLYKDIIRSRKNGFAFYHADVNFAASSETDLQDAQTRAQALELRQAPLHRLRFLNQDYAAVTSLELGEMPPPLSQPVSGTVSASESAAATPTIPAKASLESASTDPAVNRPPPPTILVPSTDEAHPLPPPAPPTQPTFESLFDPAQHSSTPAGDAPAPFAADAVALPPPSAVVAQSNELDDLAKVLDEKPEPLSATGLQLGPGIGMRSRSSSSDTEMSHDTELGTPVGPQLSSPTPMSPDTATSSSTTLASVVDNVKDVFNSLTGQETAPTTADEAHATADVIDQAVDAMPTPQQAMLEARKAHQEEIQDSQVEDGADAPRSSSAGDAHSPALTATVHNSGRSDGTVSASRTPLASSVSLPPAHAVEGFAPQPTTVAVSSASPLVIAPEPAPSLPAFSLTAAPSSSSAGNKWLRDRRWHAIVRILYVYALLNPSVGYIQGMNEVAFVIYWVMSHASAQRIGATTPATPSTSAPSPGNGPSPTTPRQSTLGTDYLNHASSGALGGRAGTPISPGQDRGASATTPSAALADELDLEADAFWCFSLLVGSVRELYEFDGIDRAAAGLRIKNARAGAGYGAGAGAIGSELGWSRAESGMAGALKRLSLRLKWVDEQLWSELRRASLDPRLPYYSFRWLACLLSNELALPSVVRLWDALLAEQDASSSAGGTAPSGAPIPSGLHGAATGLAESSRVEFLIDICAALLSRLREPLLSPPPRSSRRIRARRRRTIRRRTPSSRSGADDTDSDAPSLGEDEEEEDVYDEEDYAQDDFAYKMHILQTFPDALDLDVDVAPLLEQAYLFRQRRLAADLTGDGPPTEDDEAGEDSGIGMAAAGPTLQALGARASNAWRDWRTKSSAAPEPADTSRDGVGLGTPSNAARTPSSWFGSIGTRFASMPTPSSAQSSEAPSSPTGPRRLGGSFQRYAEALQSSDAAANLSKASTNLTAKAMQMSATWNQRNQQNAQSSEFSAPPASPWNEGYGASSKAATLGAAPSSFFAKARSVSASYMATMTNGERPPSESSAAGGGGDESDASSVTRHPTRWSRVPIPNFPLPDPNDSDGRGRESLRMGAGGLRSAECARPQSPEGSEAGSESSAGRRMLPSLRIAAKLGLLPHPQQQQQQQQAYAAVGPKPLMLSSSARPPRDRSVAATDVTSDLEMSHKVSSGPMASNTAASRNGFQSPASSPRESISSASGPSSRSYRPSGGYAYAPRRSVPRAANGNDSSRGGSESGGDHHTVSSPPSESGSGPSRRSSLTPGGVGGIGYVGTGSNDTSIAGGTRGSISSVTSTSRTSASRASGPIDYIADSSSPTVPANKFGARTGSVSSATGTADGPLGSPANAPSAWKKPAAIASSSDVPLVRTVDLRSRPRRRRQDTGSSLESMSTPVAGARGTAGNANAAMAESDAAGDNVVRYQLTDEPVAVDPSAAEAGSENMDTVTTPPLSVSSSRAKFRSRMGSTRSLGSGAQSKRSSMRSFENPGADADGVAYVPASDVLGTSDSSGLTWTGADGLDVGPPLMENDEEGHESAGEAPLSSDKEARERRPSLMSPREPVVPNLRRQSPTGSSAPLLTINTRRPQGRGLHAGSALNGHQGGYGAMTPSPLPSPGPEAGMFVSADSLLAELGAELEGLDADGGDGPGQVGVHRRSLRRRAKESSESDWAISRDVYGGSVPAEAPLYPGADTSLDDSFDGEGGSTHPERGHKVRLSETEVPQGTLDAIGSAFAQMDD